MVLKLYGVSYFTCTRRVAAILKEYNVPYELVTIDFANKEHKSEAFLKHQPFGQVPYIIDDGGFEVYESRAISRYIATKYRAQGPALLPDGSDAQELAKFEQAASIEIANFHPYAEGIIIERVYKPQVPSIIKIYDGILTRLNRSAGSVSDEGAVARNLTTLEAKLDGYESILSKQKFLAGDVSLLLAHLPISIWIYAER